MDTNQGYLMAMKSVNVAELKNRLSYYLRLVRRGEPVLVRDRDRVIARIEPAGDRDAAVGDDAERLSALEERGILRRARAPFSREILAGRPRVRRDVVAALLEEREETR
jgi:antitoxin (DNA-binding transcriptional repressor) of toxin-antitoxin stability system